MRNLERTMVAALVTAAVAAAMAGCEMPKTFTPDVEMTVSLPVLDDRVSIGEEILKADSVRTNPDDPGEMQIYLRKDSPTLRDDGLIGADRLDVDAQDPQIVSSLIGLIDVSDVVPSTTRRINVTEVSPEIAALSEPYPAALAVPATVMDLGSEPVYYDNFRFVTFSTATVAGMNQMVMSIRNATEFRLATVTVDFSTTGNVSPGGQVQDTVMPQVTFTNVAAHDSAVAAPIDLSGVTIYGTMYVVAQATVNAQTIVPVPGDIKDGYLAITTDMTALEVERAEARIPDQGFANERVITFQSPKLHLDSLVLMDRNLPFMNKFTFDVVNGLPVDVNMRFDLPDFIIPEIPVTGADLVTPTTPGDYSSATMFLPAHAQTQIEFELDNATIRKPGGGLIEELSINLTTAVIGTGDNFVVLDQTDSITVQTVVHSLAIQSVTGRVPDDRPINVGIDRFYLDVGESGIPPGLQGLQATDIAVDLDIIARQVQSTVDATLRLQVFDVDTVNELASYTRTFRRAVEDGTVFDISAARDSLGVNGNSPVDIINATLNRLFTERQASISIEGDIVVTGNVRLVRGESRVEIPEIAMSAPLRFVVPAGLTFDGFSDVEEARDLGLDASTREDVVPRADQASMFLEIENHFPVGGVLVMYVSPDPYFSRLRQEYPAVDRDALSTIPLVMPANADIDNEAQSTADGAVWQLLSIDLPEPNLLEDGSVDHQNPGRNSAPIEVSIAHRIQLFGYEHMYLLPRVQLNQSGDRMVNLSPDDYVDVQAMMFLTASTNK